MYAVEDDDEALLEDVAEATLGKQRATIGSVQARTTADMASGAGGQGGPNSARTTTDNVLNALLRETAGASSTLDASESEAQPTCKHTATDSALDTELRDVAGISSAAAAAHGGSQPDSRRTTTDSVLDRLMHEAGTTPLPLSTHHSAATAPLAAPAPPHSRKRDTADSILGAVLHETSHHGDSAIQPSASSGVRSMRSRSMTSEHDANPDGMFHEAAQSGHRLTADAMLDDMLDDVQEAEQASVDSFLDGVLDGIAGGASRQRTTADSVLDAMLNDLTSSKPNAQSGCNALSRQYSSQTAPCGQDQPQVVRHVCLSVWLYLRARHECHTSSAPATDDLHVAKGSRWG